MPITLEEEIAEVAEMVRELRAADTGFRVFGSEAHRYALRPTLSEPELARFEAEHRVSLPEDYRLFLRTVGDGGAGPYYGLESLETSALHRNVGGLFPFVEPAEIGPAEAAAGWVRHERTGFLYVGGDAFHDWMDADEPGTLEISHQGCAIYSYLVLTGPARGTVWDGCEEIIPQGIGFLPWYRAWAETSLRRVRNLPLIDRIRLGMTAEEVIQAVGGEWVERPANGRPTLYFDNRSDIPVQMDLDLDRRVVEIRPWHSL